MLGFRFPTGSRKFLLEIWWKEGEQDTSYGRGTELGILYVNAPSWQPAHTDNTHVPMSAHLHKGYDLVVPAVTENA